MKVKWQRPDTKEPSHVVFSHQAANAIDKAMLQSQALMALGECGEIVYTVYCLRMPSGLLDGLVIRIASDSRSVVIRYIAVIYVDSYSFGLTVCKYLHELGFLFVLHFY